MQTWNTNESSEEMSSVVTAGGIKDYFFKNSNLGENICQI